MSLPLQLQFLVTFFVGWVTRQQADVIAYLQEENAVLVQQLGGTRLRLTDAQRARTNEDLEALVVQIAQENPTFGYTRIRDTLSNLGHEIGRTTVQAILSRHGIEPAPEREKRTSWADFLGAHWEAIAAMDFFSVEVLTLRGLVRYQVLFVIDLATRRVELAGITSDAHGAWVLQVGRNLTDAVDGFLRGKRFLIMDRDPLFTKPFRQLLQGSGVEPVRLPRRSPNLNAYSERFVRSVRREALRRIVPLGEAHLRRALTAYLVHYHRERNHQGLLPSDQRRGSPRPPNPLIAPGEEVGRREGRIVCRKRLGGCSTTTTARRPEPPLFPSFGDPRSPVFAQASRTCTSSATLRRPSSGRVDAQDRSTSQGRTRFLARRTSRTVRVRLLNMTPRQDLWVLLSWDTAPRA